MHSSVLHFNHKLQWMKMKTTLALLLILKLCGLSSCLIKQHFFVDQQKTWDSAKNYCKTYFHDLSNFTSENEEQQFLKYAKDEPSDAWVGLYKESGVWKWSGGKNATQISWDAGRPDNTDGCAYIHKVHNKLHDTKCDDEYAFFCMNISEFVLVSQKETWEGALEYCRSYYYDLASMSTMNRMNSALKEISQAETEYVWTGLRFIEEWFWVSGEDLDYTAWYQNEQPQCPAGDLRCGALDKQTKLWTHRNCEEKLSFVCQ